MRTFPVPGEDYTGEQSQDCVQSSWTQKRGVKGRRVPVGSGGVEAALSGTKWVLYAVVEV